MRLKVRHGEALRFHQRWKLRGAAAVGGLLLAGTILSITFSSFGAELSRQSGLEGAIPGSRRLEGKGYGSTKKRKLASVYPDDKVIGKYDGDGNEDWDNGKYGNAPASRKIGIIVHIIGIMYMLVGLNTVCDIYFCGALDEMVEKWQVKPDVAGATFMAAGGSAPELFTSLIGACITEDDVGFGTIVGSAVFNVLAVIGCCGITANEPIHLSWWPLFRDCTFYIFGLLLLAIFAYGESIEMPNGDRIGGGKIELYEAILLFLTYLLYCTIMVFNEKLESKIQGYLDRVKGRLSVGPSAQKVAPAPIQDGTDGAPKDGDDKELREGARAEDAAPGPPQHHLGADVAPEKLAEEAKKPEAEGEKARSSTHSNKDHALDHHLRRVHHKSHVAHHHHHSGDGQGHVVGVARSTLTATPSIPEEEAKGVEVEAPAVAQDADAQSDESDEDDVEMLMRKPDNTKDTILWCLSLPIYAGLYYTLPKPSPKYFMATFAIALIWIAAYSFVLVYCVGMFGDAILGGGDNVTIVMSFTLLAAGTSIPDLVSSMAVARAGEGDMAVSSSIGSNIFDILVGLPVPWMLKIGLVEMAIGGKSSYSVHIKSPYIALYVFLLLFMVGCVILSIHFNGWRLNKPLGMMMAGLYVVFLAIVLPVELINKGPYV